MKSRNLWVTLLVPLFIFYVVALPIASHNSPSINYSLELDRPPASLSDTSLFNLTFTSYWNSTPTPVKSGDHIVGDHIILNATWASTGKASHIKIVVNATAVPNWIVAEKDGASVAINTRALGANHTCAINMTVLLLNGSTIYERITGVFLGNFFTPHVIVLSPNGSEIWTGVHNVTWNAWDENLDETLLFDVRLSSDGGHSFQSIAGNLDQMWYSWNTDGFLDKDTYVIEVRASDGIYIGYDRSDGVFRAGNIPVSSPPTTTTMATTTTMPHVTTTTTATETSTTTSTTGSTTPSFLPTAITALVITISIIASAVLAVGVYYTAKRNVD